MRHLRRGLVGVVTCFLGQVVRVDGVCLCLSACKLILKLQLHFGFPGSPATTAIKEEDDVGVCLCLSACKLVIFKLQLELLEKLNDIL